MPGKPSLGALLHIYSPIYVKSGPGDLPERPEKSPTLWGPLTRICDMLNIEGHKAKKISGENSSTILNHIRCSKNTFTVVNVVFCTKSQIL